MLYYKSRLTLRDVVLLGNLFCSGKYGDNVDDVFFCFPFFLSRSVHCG